MKKSELRHLIKEELLSERESKTILHNLDIVTDATLELINGKWVEDFVKYDTDIPETDYKKYISYISKEIKELNKKASTLKSILKKL